MKKLNYLLTLLLALVICGNAWGANVVYIGVSGSTTPGGAALKTTWLAAMQAAQAGDTIRFVSDMTGANKFTGSNYVSNAGTNANKNNIVIDIQGYTIENSHSNVFSTKDANSNMTIIGSGGTLKNTSFSSTKYTDNFAVRFFSGSNQTISLKGQMNLIGDFGVYISDQLYTGRTLNVGKDISTKLKTYTKKMASSGLVVNNEGTLEIIDQATSGFSSITNSGTMTITTANMSSGITLVNTGSLTIGSGVSVTMTSGTIEGTFVNNGTLSLKGGKVLKSLWTTQNLQNNVASGYKGTEVTEGGNTYMKIEEDLSQMAAMIGTTSYVSFDAAYDAVQSGQTIKLLRDIEETSKEINPVKANITIDLNGFKMKQTGHLKVSGVNFSLISSNGVGEYTNTHYNAIYVIGANSNVTIDNVVIKGATQSDMSITAAGATITMKNGASFQSTGALNTAIANNANAFTLITELTNGSLTNPWNGTGVATIQNKGTLTLSNTTARTGIISSNTGTLTISDGKYTSVTNTGSITFNGGVFDAGSLSGTVVINSGKFKKTWYEDANLAQYVTSGALIGETTISSVVYKQILTANPNAVARIGLTEYMNMNAAMQAAKDGEEILVTKDAAFAYNGSGYATFETTKSFTLNLQNHTLTGTSADCYWKISSSNVVIKNGTITKPGSYQAIKLYGKTAEASLTLDNVTVKNTGTSSSAQFAISLGDASASSDLNNFYDITFTMKNGAKVQNTLGTALFRTGTHSTDPKSLTINIEANTTLSSSAVSFIGSPQGKLKKLTINNAGTFNFARDEFSKASEWELNNHGTATVVGYNMMIDNYGTADIYYGTYDKANLTNHAGATMNIKSGTYLAAQNLSEGTVNVFGGTFLAEAYPQQALKDALASGKQIYASYINGEPAYKVAEEGLPVIATIGSTNYYFMSDAFKGAADQQTIVLQQNTPTDEACAVYGKAITLDMNNHNITNCADRFCIKYGGSLTVTGTGTIYDTTQTVVFQLNGDTADVALSAYLKIDKNVTLDTKYGSGAGIWGSELKQMHIDGYHHANGATIDVAGTIKCESDAVYINGNIRKDTTFYGKGAQVIIEPTAKLIARDNDLSMYLAGYGNTTIEGGEIQGRVDIRAGELTINGGTYTSIANGPVVFEKNYNGSAIADGSSCNVGIAQHSTKQTTMVTINGGTFKSVTPIAQGNPQENKEVWDNMVRCVVKGGFFKSTSASDTDIVICDKVNRVALQAGFYNEKPAAKSISQGYEAIAITNDDYPVQYADGYRWRIGLIGQKGTTETVVKGDWNNPDTWKDGVLPNASIQVVLNDSVTLDTVGYAYGVSCGDNAKLIVLDKGVLVVGQGLVTGATASRFKIKDNGQLLIAPETLCQPQATVDYVAKVAGKKSGVETPTKSNQLYWEQMAVPTKAGGLESFDVAGQDARFNIWDITEAWQKVDKSTVNQPFKGYFMTNFSEYSAEDKDITYTFDGTLVGNSIITLNFNREGFTFFGNSYLAPISIMDLLTNLQVSGVDPTVYIYQPKTTNYHTINYVTVGRGGRPTEINKLQGFFVYAKKKASANISYKDVVWDPLLAKLSMNAAPARKAMVSEIQEAISTYASITVTSAKGMADEVVLVEEEGLTNGFDYNYDAQKMMGDYVNIYVPAAQKMAIHAVAELEGTPITVKTTNEVAYTLTFSDIEGKELELYDAETETVVPMTEGATYEFIAQANATIEGRFSIRKAPTTPDTSTNLQAVGGAQIQKGIYTVMGQYLGEATMWDALPNGVYVVNGQKVVK